MPKGRKQSKWPWLQYAVLCAFFLLGVLYGCLPLEVQSLKAHSDMQGAPGAAPVSISGAPVKEATQKLARAQIPEVASIRSTTMALPSVSASGSTIPPVSSSGGFTKSNASTFQSTTQRISATLAPRLPRVEAENLAPGDDRIQRVEFSATGAYTRKSLLGAELSYSSDQYTYSYDRGGTMDFPSAWLATRHQVQIMAGWFTHFIEENIYNIDNRRFMRRHRNQMTLDFFDYCAAHLSFWADLAGIRSKKVQEYDKNQQRLWNYLKTKLSADITRLMSTPSMDAGSQLSKKTVALIPYASGKYAGGNLDTPAFLFVNATFWSVRRQFDKVVIGACDEVDFAAASLLPAWKTIKLTGHPCGMNTGEVLLKHVQAAFRGTTADAAEWSAFEYVYFTEGDMMLSIRRHADVERVVRAEKYFVPHRFEAFPIASDLPAPSLVNSQMNSALIDSAIDTSHCCLAGRILACAEFWWVCYQRLPYGAKGIFHLLNSTRFAPHGLPVGLGTHGGGPIAKDGRGSGPGHGMTTGPEFCQICTPGAPCPCAAAG